jgi:hypothetical protein
VVRAVDSLPAMTGELVVTIARVNQLLEQVESEQLPQRMAATLTSADLTFATLRTQLDGIAAEELSRETRVTMANLNAAVTKMHSVLERVDSKDGLLASAQRTSDAIGTAAGSARGIEATLRDVREAAVAFRELVDALELEPDMLLKGRAQAVDR